MSCDLKISAASMRLTNNVKLFLQPAKCIDVDAIDFPAAVESRIWRDNGALPLSPLTIEADQVNRDSAPVQPTPCELAPIRTYPARIRLAVGGRWAVGGLSC